jgi:predicted RNase H-like nuclease (RuvC/YqgF family)
VSPVEWGTVLGSLGGLVTAAVAILGQRRARVTNRDVKSVASWQGLNNSLQRELDRLTARNRELEEALDTCRSEKDEEIRKLRALLTPQQLATLESD